MKSFASFCTMFHQVKHHPHGEILHLKCLFCHITIGSDSHLKYCSHREKITSVKQNKKTQAKIYAQDLKMKATFLE